MDEYDWYKDYNEYYYDYEYDVGVMVYHSDSGSGSDYYESLWLTYCVRVHVTIDTQLAGGLKRGILK